MNVMSRHSALGYLAKGVKIGHLATVRSNGRPHVAPVWFVVDGGDIVFNTAEDSVKGKNLVREGRAAMSVDDANPPYSHVIVNGPVHISEDPDELLAFATRIGGRYMGSDRAAEFGARNGVAGEYLVRLHCESLIGATNVSD
jgi:PPOX class probable F420-dependent enzyme